MLLVTAMMPLTLVVIISGLHYCMFEERELDMVIVSKTDLHVDTSFKGISLKSVRFFLAFFFCFNSRCISTPVSRSSLTHPSHVLPCLLKVLLKHIFFTVHHAISELPILWCSRTRLMMITPSLVWSFDNELLKCVVPESWIKVSHLQ